MRNWRLLLLSCGLLAGCAKDTDLAKLQQSVNELKKTSETAAADLATLRKDLEGRLDAVEIEQLTTRIGAIAYLTPGAEGYSVVETDLGPMTVKLDNVEAYANGSRIRLQFGNLSSATVNGAKATVEWGSVTAKGRPDNTTKKEREVTFTESLRAGAWTSVRVVLEGVPPTSLGFVRVKDLGHTGISLLR